MLDLLKSICALDRSNSFLYSAPMNDNLKKLIELAKADSGKFFVIDENGNPQLVIMGIAEYEKVLLRKMHNQIEDIDEINKKIAVAKKQQDAETARQLEQEQLKSEVIDSTFMFEGVLPRTDYTD